MSLFRAEARRLGKRRLTRWLAVALLLLLATIMVSVSVQSEKITPAVKAQAAAKAQQEYQEQLRFHQDMTKQCEAAKARGEDITKNFPPDCGKESPPTPEMFQAEWHLPPEFVFRDDFGPYLAVLAGVMALFAFIIGASYVGAEWTSGGMSNLLLWRPRRLTVLGTKLAVLLTAVLASAVPLAALWTAAFWLIGKYDGRTGNVTSGAWQSYAITGARGVTLALAVAAAGFALASIGRHTAMALGAAVGIGVIVEVGARIGLGVAKVDFGERFLLSTYTISWLLKKWTLVNWESCVLDRTGQCQPAEYVVTWQQSAVVLGLGTVLLVGTALWTMRNRDIT